MIEHVSKLENLELFMNEIRRCAASAGLSSSAAGRVELCVEEAVVNIMSYAYPAGAGPFRLDCSNDGETLTITIEDRGVPFNMLERESPDLTLSASEREPGGLGIFLIKEFMDDVEHRREGDRNVLVLRKRINS